MTRSTSIRGCAAVIGAVLMLAGSVSVATASGADSDTVLVKLDRHATRAERAVVSNVLGAEASRGLPAGWRAYRVPGGMTLAGARDRLAQTDADLAVELDGVVRATFVPDDPAFDLLYAMPLIQATTAWDLLPQGEPVVVAVTDSGVDVTHPDLAPMVWTNPAEVPNGADDDFNGRVDDIEGWDFFHNDATVYDDPVEDSHGTHVAGTIGAVRNNAMGVAGVADNVRLMPVKFLGADGAGSTSGAIAAITYARQNGARIINASWAGNMPSQALCDTVAAAVADGVLFVAAAGNDGLNNDSVVSEPSDCPGPGVVSVAATTDLDTLAGFSNFGPTTVDLGAPGVGVLSTLPNDSYGALDGTSMAAPHVSGAAALILGQVPAAGPEDLRTALLSGGDPLAGLAGVTVSGRRLNVANAIDVAITNQGGTPPPDTAPPNPFVLAQPADGDVTTVRPDFSWGKAVDGRSGISRYRLFVDGAVVTETPATLQKATPPIDLAEGPHSWFVEAEDGAGNRRATATRTLLVDAGPPQPFGLDVPSPGAHVRSNRPDFRWAEAVDRGAGLAGYRLVIDGATSPTYFPEARAASPEAALGDGAHLWRVEAVDRLGRVQPTADRVVVVDTKAPAAFGLRTPLDGIRVRTRRPGFAWSPSKDVGGAVTYEIVLNGKVRATALTKPSWRPPAVLRFGRYRWSVNAVDAAGNVRTSPKEDFTIVKPRPKKRPKRK